MVRGPSLCWAEGEVLWEPFTGSLASVEGDFPLSRPWPPSGTGLRQTEALSFQGHPGPARTHP